MKNKMRKGASASLVASGKLAQREATSVRSLRPHSASPKMGIN